MKILFLDHPQFTSASYFLWHGLNEVLPDKPCLFPPVPTHYEAAKVDLRGFDWWRDFVDDVQGKRLPYGIPPFHESEGLLGGSGTEIVRYDLGRRFESPKLYPSERNIVERLNDEYFDLAILANGHRVPTLALARLKERAKRLPPIVYLDAGERDELNEHWVHVFRPALTFKQILTPQVLEIGLTVKIPEYTFTLLPLPLSSIVVGQEDAGGVPFSKLRGIDGPYYKTYDLFYRMGPTWEPRALLQNRLDRLVERYGLTTAPYSTFADYHKILALSRIAVTMRGSGRDTLRYWEIPLYETLMVADGTMGCIHPYPFEDQKTAAFYRSLDELENVVLMYADRNRTADAKHVAIAQAGKAHLARYHSTAARAVFFLERVKEHLGITDRDTEAAIRQRKALWGWEDRDWAGPVEGGTVVA